MERQSSRIALISVTRVIASKGADEMAIYLSVFPGEKEAAAMDFVERKSVEFRKFVAEHTKIKTLPKFIFVIDQGEKNRQRIEELLRT